jgi:hypothetical protein
MDIALRFACCLSSLTALDIESSRTLCSLMISRLPNIYTKISMFNDVKCRGPSATSLHAESGQLELVQATGEKAVDMRNRLHCRGAYLKHSRETEQRKVVLKGQ